MNTVNVAELKNRLSHYLRLVRRGQSVLVRDRDHIIARIEPAGDRDAYRHDDAAHLAALERRGILRRGKGAIPGTLLKRRPRITVDVVAALLREREEGR